MVFCNFNTFSACDAVLSVTILILIDGFLQYSYEVYKKMVELSHNPYFNRWFSAIADAEVITSDSLLSHNPYFNRWFSAILKNKGDCIAVYDVTILILIDGFLQ